MLAPAKSGPATMYRTKNDNGKTNKWKTVEEARVCEGSPMGVAGSMVGDGGWEGFVKKMRFARKL